MPDPGRIKVTPEVAAASTHIRQRAVALDQELDALRPQVAALAYSWQGAHAAENYQLYQRNWDNSAEALWGRDGTTGLLPNIAGRIEIIAGNYYETEAINANGWAHG
jgi:uncharacterized protein YukE